MALFGRDYSDDFGYRGSQRGGYDRGFASRDRGGLWGDRNRSSGGMGGYDTDHRNYGYDRNYKSRWQTDHGDPFNDRQNDTPIRVLRGPYEASGYGRDFDRGRGYDRGYSRNPMSYEPYGGSGMGGRGGMTGRGGMMGRGGMTGRGDGGATGGWNAMGDRQRGGSGRGMDRGYDRGWF